MGAIILHSAAIFCAMGSYKDPAQEREYLSEIIEKPLITVHQVHSHIVYDVDEVYNELGSRETISYFRNRDGDGLVTSLDAVSLGVVTADCTPVVIIDETAGIYGIAHAGRRGVCDRIVPHLIDMMVAKGADVSHIYAWIGPHICGKCYETGVEIAQDFNSQFPETSTITTYGGPGVDMTKAIEQQLTNKYVLRKNIVESQLCTLEDERLYSYRRHVLSEGAYPNGRFFTIVAPHIAFDTVLSRAEEMNNKLAHEKTRDKIELLEL